MDRFHQGTAPDAIPSPSNVDIPSVNPFARRESHGASSVTTYKVLTILTWLLSAVVTIYYAVEAPRDGRYHRGSIWHQNHDHHTGFSLSPIITSIYWYSLHLSGLATPDQH